MKTFFKLSTAVIMATVCLAKQSFAQDANGVRVEGTTQVGSAESEKNLSPKLFQLNGRAAQSTFQAMGDAQFDPEASNGGVSYYAKVRCEKTSTVAGRVSVHCVFIESDSGEYSKP